jgi:hypothetical protein
MFPQIYWCNLETFVRNLIRLLLPTVRRLLETATFRRIQNTHCGFSFQRIVTSLQLVKHHSGDSFDSKMIAMYHHPPIRNPYNGWREPKDWSSRI